MKWNLEIGNGKWKRKEWTLALIEFETECCSAESDALLKRLGRKSSMLLPRM